MKKKMFILMMLLAVIPLASGQSSSSTSKRVIFSRTSQPKDHRPAEPAGQIIDCLYDGNALHIEFLYPEGSSRAIIDTRQYGFDSSQPAELEIGPVSNTEVILITEYGNEYRGKIE